MKSHYDGVALCHREKIEMLTSFFSFVPPEIRNGNLKSILGLFFILSRYKQQQQQQQQYYQSLVELSQQTSSTGPSASKTQEMQSRYGALLIVVLVWCWFRSHLGQR